MAAEAAVRKTHSLILEDRKRLSLSGVKDVAGFSEQSVTLLTELGELCVKGSDLHIGSFSQETGELSLDGVVDSLVYSESRQTEGGFFARLFR